MAGPGQQYTDFGAVPEEGDQRTGPLLTQERQAGRKPGARAVPQSCSLQDDGITAAASL